jgi:hypothetical protein
MRKTLLVLAAFVAAIFMQAQTSDYFVPYKQVTLRLPSVPLLVNDPYFSFWSPYNHLYDGTVKHWDNQQKAMDGLLRVDGKVYRFMGAKRSTKLLPIAPMGNRGGYRARVRTSLSSSMTDTWMNLDFNDTNWQFQTGPWGTKGDYPYVQTEWGNSADRYIRRHITLTAEDIRGDLWLIYSHDDKCEAYINGVRVVNVTEEKWNQNVKLHLTGAARAALVEGDNVIAYHVHNSKGGALADIGLYKNELGFHPGYEAIPGAAMADEAPWEAKVKTTSVSGTVWARETFDDSSWETEQGAFGTPNEYPNVNTSWTATGSDYYIRRRITLTAEDLQKELTLIYSHDDVCQAYINGRRIVNTGNTWVQNVVYKLTANDKAVLHEGENVIAYHVHNTTGGALADIGLYYSTNTETPAVQTACDVLPTSTYYTFTCGPVDLDVVFTAPFLMNDIELMSTPINFISYQVRSNDGQEHNVQFYYGTTPELTVDNNLQATVSTIESGNDGRRYIKSGSRDQKVLGKAGDGITIDWGYLYLPDVNGSIAVADQGLTASTFASTGALPESTLPFASSDEGEMPQLSYVHDFGTVSQASSYMMFGYDEVKDIRYMDVDYKGYWARNGKTIQQAFAEFQQSYDDIMTRCKVQDQIIYDDGLAAGNVKYAELLCASYRQCIAAHKIFEDNKGNLLFFSKENNSNGCVNTVDLTYPSAPLFLLYNTDLMKGMCTSILDYCESDRWGFDFAAHDLGTYPHANNQVYAIRFPGAGGDFGGNMPIEESANIVILAAAISDIDGNTEWADRYWATLTKWTNYLVENGQDPENQLCTDDFSGHLAHNANLAVKAIMGVAGYAKLCWLRGDQEGYTSFLAKAKEMASNWVRLAKEGSHFKLAYDKPGTWSQKYNMVWDKAWNTGVFSNLVKTQEFNYYVSSDNNLLKTYGLPLDSRSSYTKSDWEMWTAAMANTNLRFLTISDLVWKYVNETPSRVPLSDWYYTDGNGGMAGFRARSVVGGHWMKVYVDKKLNGEIGTSIAPIQAQEETNGQWSTFSGQWYNLSGQKTEAPAQRGIYIQNGKKKVVR